MKVPRAVLFDLDGTLIDTAPDLIGAVNGLLGEDGRPQIPPEELRHEASNGSRGLLRATYGVEPGAPEWTALQRRFLDAYRARISRQSRCFDGVPELIDHMTALPLPWGVVTNKPGALARQLLADLGLTPAVTIGGDAAPRPKPAPDILELACAHLRIRPTQCIYVGDAPRDIQAGNAAGMTTIAAAYGYLSATCQVQTWEADYVAEDPYALWPLIRDLAS